MTNPYEEQPQAQPSPRLPIRRRGSGTPCWAASAIRSAIADATMASRTERLAGLIRGNADLGFGILGIFVTIAFNRLAVPGKCKAQAGRCTGVAHSRRQ